MNVLILPEVRQYFYELSYILYEKDYFSFLDKSEQYVEELIRDIQENLPTKRHKPAPNHFDKYGKTMKYASFKKNRHTTWYAFFKTYEDNGQTFYLVRYIANNHVIAQYL
jgi:hypothetical protein